MVRKILASCALLVFLAGVPVSLAIHPGFAVVQTMAMAQGSDSTHAPADTSSTPAPVPAPSIPDGWTMLVAAVVAFAAGKITTWVDAIPDKTRKLTAPVAALVAVVVQTLAHGQALDLTKLVMASGATSGLFSIVKNLLQLFGKDWLSYGTNLNSPK